MRTRGLGLLGKKLSIDLLTSILHTLVIREYKSVVDLYKRGGEASFQLQQGKTLNTMPPYLGEK